MCLLHNSDGQKSRFNFYTFVAVDFPLFQQWQMNRAESNLVCDHTSENEELKRSVQSHLNKA